MDARSDFWHGDTSWGPRHLHVAIVPTVLFGVINVASMIQQSAPVWFRKGFLAISALGIFVQIIALPLHYELEVDQWKAGYVAPFPPSLRIMNLVARITDNNELWGLSCKPSERVRNLQNLPIQFVPFQIAAKLPGSKAVMLIKLLWLIGLSVLLICIAFWGKKIVNDLRKKNIIF
jgi:hypothetical protein